MSFREPILSDIQPAVGEAMMVRHTRSAHEERGMGDRGVPNLVKKGWSPNNKRDVNKIEAAEDETDQPQVAVAKNPRRDLALPTFLGRRVIRIRLRAEDVI